MQFSSQSGFRSANFDSLDDVTSGYKMIQRSGYKMIQRSGIKVIQQEVVYSLSKREVITNVSIGASNGNKDFRSARQEFEADIF
jgi:hypothetical protein